MKAAILEANFYEPVYQRAYKAMSEHYGYEIIPCRVRKPQEKGKVEAGIKYVKSNFFKGRSFANKVDVENQLNAWVKYKCNSRVHGTTKKVPAALGFIFLSPGSQGFPLGILDWGGSNF